MCVQNSNPFFKLLTLLVEGSGGGAGAAGGLPCFTQLVLARLWDVADVCPHAALEWLALQVSAHNTPHHATPHHATPHHTTRIVLINGPDRTPAAFAVAVGKELSAGQLQRFTTTPF